MLIIVEGCDGAGKTTFVSELKRRIEARTLNRFTEVQVMHKGPPTQHPLDEYETPLFQYTPSRLRTIICDRWHLGEGIYPHVLKRTTQYDRAVRRHIEMFLLSKGAYLVILQPTIETLRERVQRRGDDLVHVSQLSRISLEYGHAAQSSLLPTRIIHGAPTVMDYDSVISNAETAVSIAHSLSAFTTYIGPRFPQTLLLGDRRNPPYNQQGGYPAFGPYASTSGHYLLTHLERPRLVGIANACDVDDWRVLHAVLGRPKIVTLGALAHRAVTIPHGAVPHPQYIRRFHHSAGGAYGAAITQASKGDDLSKWRP